MRRLECARAAPVYVVLQQREKNYIYIYIYIDPRAIIKKTFVIYDSKCAYDCILYYFILSQCLGLRHLYIYILCSLALYDITLHVLTALNAISRMPFFACTRTHTRTCQNV